MRSLGGNIGVPPTSSICVYIQRGLATNYLLMGYFGIWERDIKRRKYVPGMPYPTTIYGRSQSFAYSRSKHVDRASTSGI